MKSANRKVLEGFRSQSEAGFKRGEVVAPKQRGLLITFLKFLTVMIPYWDKALITVLVIMCLSMARLLYPWLDKYLVDDVFPNKDWDLLFWIIIGRLGLGLIGRFANSMNYIFTRFVDMWVLTDLKSRFYDHLVRLSMTFLQSRPVGQHMYRAGADIGAVMFMITDILPDFLAAIFDFIIVFAFLTYLDPIITILLLIYMIPYTMLAHWLATLVRRFDKEARHRWEMRDAVLQEGVAGQMVVKTFARRQFEVNKFMRRTVEGWRAQMKKQYTFMVKQQLIGRWGFVPWLKGHLVRVWFLRQAILGHISYGSLLPIFNYMNRFTNPIQEIIDLFQSLRIAMVPAERILQTVDLAPVVVNKPGAINMPPLEGRVLFDNVDFSYEEGIPILYGLGFEVQPGQKVAFIGHSGAGKSTVVNLVLRLYDPDSGRVLVDGIDLTDVRMESYQQQIGLVFQETYLFGGTVRDNILFSNPRASQQQIKQAIELADLEEFVEELPFGLDTDLSEGTSLSGGQKQRLGIARALARDPKLLILDEPTSSLDAETEERVLETLDKAMKGRTTFIISHRMPTVVDADIIFAMDKGRVVEFGSHDELMEKRGYYHELYTLYFAGRTQDVA